MNQYFLSKTIHTECYHHQNNSLCAFVVLKVYASKTIFRVFDCQANSILLGQRFNDTYRHVHIVCQQPMLKCILHCILSDGDPNGRVGVSDKGGSHLITIEWTMIRFKSAIYQRVRINSICFLLCTYKLRWYYDEFTGK